MELELTPNSASTWRGGKSGHICNCIGCCEKCGMCRTHPKHTEGYCALLVKQAKEREEFVA